MQTFKLKLYRTLESGGESGTLSKVVEASLIVLIVGNVIAIILESYQDLAQSYETYFATFEVFTIGVFTVTYMCRLWSCTANDNFLHPVWGRLKFVVQPLIVIDLVAIAPFYLQVYFPEADYRIFLLARLSRLFLLFKLARYNDAFSTLGRVFYNKRMELGLTVFVASIVIIVGATIMYILESAQQPEKLSTVPDAIWWTIITLTTVGYGDIFPVTGAGKVLAGVLAIFGIGFIALPTAVLGSGFLEELQGKNGQEERYCPHCGGKIKS